METSRTGFIGTTIRIQSFIPSLPKASFLLKPKQKHWNSHEL